MQLPLQITFRHMERSPALEAAIRDHAEKLNSFCPRLTSCRIVVEEVAAHKHQGKLFSLHLDLTMPGHEIAITRDRHEDAFVALRNAFDAAKRKLAEETRIMRGEIKNHPVEQHGRIARIDLDGGFGFIETEDASTFYFTRDNVSALAFGKLTPGTTVQFVADFAGDTPQAKRVVVH